MKDAIYDPDTVLQDYSPFALADNFKLKDHHEFLKGNKLFGERYKIFAETKIIPKTDLAKIDLFVPYFRGKQIYNIWGGKNKTRNEEQS